MDFQDYTAVSILTYVVCFYVIWRRSEACMFVLYSSSIAIGYLHSSRKLVTAYSYLLDVEYCDMLYRHIMFSLKVVLETSVEIWTLEHSLGSQGHQAE